MKNVIKRIPLVRSVTGALYFLFINKVKPFSGSKNYWNKRYDSGNHSGDGSHNNLALFKAEVLNQFVKEKEIQTVVELGCGDGNQLSHAQYPSYIGFDVSQTAIDICISKFSDKTKQFYTMRHYTDQKAELTLSLDVIYHLVENTVFEEYMLQLFSSSLKYVVIYSSNTDRQRRIQGAHVKHRKFTKWIKVNKPEWRQTKSIKNRYPYTGNDENSSFSDFFFFERSSQRY